MLCSYCHAPIPAKVHPYTVRIELFPAIEPSLEISEADLKNDHRKELQNLVEIMAKMSDEEVLEQEKLMYISHSFMLCRACRDRVAAQLERLKPPAS